MKSARFGWLVLALGVLGANAWSADPKPTPAPPAKSNSKTEPKTAPAEPAKPRTLDSMKLPAGAILVICKEAKNALDLIPSGFVLSPEKYQELLDQIEALKRQAKPARAEIPSSCKLLNGQVEGDVVKLQAQFDFRTEKPRTLVTFGCQRAWLRSASLDGHLPLFAAAGADDGVVIQVESAGVHQLTADLALPLAPRGVKGSERGFDLGLPGAAITSLEQFIVPVAAAEVRVNGRTVKTRIEGASSRVEGVALGRADHLEMIWKGPAPATAKGKTILAADGKINVRVDDKTVTTDVDLTLQTLRGEAKVWKIFLPPNAVPELREPLPQDERIESKEMPTPRDPWITIKLKEPSAEPLRVAFQISQARTGNRVAIGPFSVADTLRHRGTVTVRSPADLRLRLLSRPNLKERELTDEMRRERVFSTLSYWNLPAPQNPNAPGPALLELEVEAVKGAVETRVDHTLQQGDNNVQIVSRIDATPIRTGVEQIELAVQPDFAKHFDRDRGASPATLIEDVVFDEKRNVAVVKLAEKQFAPFSVSLPFTYPLGKEQKSLTVDLPRPVQTLDRGGQATVQLAEGRALVTRQPSPDAPPPGSRKHTWRWDHAPVHFGFEWHDYHPEFPVETLADVTLLDGQARVRQRIDLQFPGAPPAFVTLVVPAALRGRVKLEQGGTLDADGLVRLDRPARNVSLVLTYIARAEPVAGARPAKKDGEAAEELLSIPLVQPPPGTRVETKARIWADPGVSVQAADYDAWVRLPAEVLPEKDSLPALVLRSVHPKPALALKQRRSAEAPVASVVIDRALVQVTLAEEGYQNYRARFRIVRVGARHIDLEMPAPISGLNLEVTLDGKKISQIQTLDASGKGVDNGTVLRLLVEPDLYTRPVILDVHYQLAPGRSRGKGVFHSTVAPPEPRGDVFLGRVRWQIVTPQNWLALQFGGGYSTEQRWEWHGGLLSPRPAVNAADLERWLGVAAEDGPVDEGAAGLVCSRADLSPFSILQVPQQGWLLLCSVLFLVVGLCLAFASIPRGLFWFAIALLGGGAAYLSVTWPSLVPAFIYGCEPGAAVLLIILGVQWMLQKHHRRQLVFLPGFTRVKGTASALMRDGPVTRTRGEPSTVDVPRAKKESSFQ